MLQLYSAPRTRAVRVAWLLEELGTPYELISLDFKPTRSEFFIQETPTGKVPTLVDGELVMCESGAIVEYLLEKHGETPLAPRPGTVARGMFLQWLHFAESTAFPPLGIVVWLSRYRDDAAQNAKLLADARERVEAGLGYVERTLEGGDYLVGGAFTAADIMMGFTLQAATILGLMDDRYPRLQQYLERITDREAFRTAAQKTGNA